MFKELSNEAKLSFVLHTKSPLSIRNQKTNVMDPTLPDMQCMRSRYHGMDTVIIPGSSLKGVIRSRYEKIVNLFEGKCCNVVDRYDACKVSEQFSYEERGKKVYEKVCPACQLFGSTSIGARIRFTDAYPMSSPVIGERNGVGINRITGAAQRGALYDFEVVEEGSFHVEIFLQNYELYQLVLLLYVLKDLDEGYVTVGGATTRGNGRLELTDFDIEFREYRKNVNCLKDIKGETAFENNERYSFNFNWEPLFYGKVNLKVTLDELINELKTVDVRGKVQNNRK